jgi:hypothetical protein
MVELKCEWCGTSFRRQKRQRFCGPSCSAKWRMSRPDFVASLHTPKRAEACRQVMQRLRRNPQAMENLRRYLLSGRNPFRDPVKRAEAQRKAHSRLAASGYRTLNGGNGRGPTRPQLMLATLLGWPTEYVVPTKGLPGYPSHYKLDIANPKRRIAIEVDGQSHSSKAVRAKDIKKTRFLEERGWTVLRFRNAEVLRNLSAVLWVIQQALSSTTSKQHPGTTSPVDCSSTIATA